MAIYRMYFPKYRFQADAIRFAAAKTTGVGVLNCPNCPKSVAPLPAPGEALTNPLLVDDGVALSFDSDASLATWMTQGGAGVAEGALSVVVDTADAPAMLVVVGPIGLQPPDPVPFNCPNCPKPLQTPWISGTVGAPGAPSTEHVALGFAFTSCAAMEAWVQSPAGLAYLGTHPRGYAVC